MRRRPWTTSLLFWLEIRRTRDEDGEARFACPLAAPVQRRRPVPREPACPEVSHE